MSRIGKKPITIPDNVTVTKTDNKIIVKKDNQQLSQDIPKGLKLEVKDSQVFVTVTDNQRQTKAFHGLIRSLIQNMIIGVTQGYQKTLELHGTGFRVSAKGQGIEMTLGFSHPVVFDPPEGIKLEVTNQTTIVISGVDKQLVGEVAAKIRQSKPPDSYKGKGVRYQGEEVKLKPGKAAKAAEGA